MENPIKMDDLGVPPFLEIPIYIYINSRWSRYLWTMNHHYKHCGLTSRPKFGCPKFHQTFDVDQVVFCKREYLHVGCGPLTGFQW